MICKYAARDPAAPIYTSSDKEYTCSWDRSIVPTDCERKNTSGHAMVRKGGNAKHIASMSRCVGTFSVPSKILQYGVKLSGTSEDVDETTKSWKAAEDKDPNTNG